jgi:hypothetical protein
MGSAYEGTNFEKDTYGSAGEWNKSLNNPPSSDSGSSGGYTAPNYNVVIAVGQQVFRCTAWGLKPNTVHKAYLLTTDVSGDCAPIVVTNVANTANVAANTAAPPNTNSPLYGSSGYSTQLYSSGVTTRRAHVASLLNQNGSGYSGNTQTTTTYNYGVDLVTTADGKLVFDYRFVPQNAPYPTRTVYGSNTKVSIIPFGQQAFKVVSADGSSKASSFIMSKQTT